MLWFFGVLADHKLEIGIGVAVLFVLGLIAWQAIGKSFDRAVRGDEDDRSR